MRNITSISITDEDKDFLFRNGYKPSGFLHEKITETKLRIMAIQNRKDFEAIESELRKCEDMKSIMLRFIQTKGLFDEYRQYKKQLEDIADEVKPRI
jgi:hypothetical protein